MKDNFIKIENLKKIYSKREVVSNVSIQLNKGEVIGLLGPNGAGKTTTFYMITGMVRVSSGSIFLGDKDITNICNLVYLSFLLFFINKISSEGGKG